MTLILTAVAWAFFGLGWALVIRQWRHAPADGFWSCVSFTTGDAFYMAAEIAARNWIVAAFFAVMTVGSALICLLYWRRRKRRGRLAAIGAKSKARIAAMTARMRERPARPALRPVPGGAR